MYNHVGRNTCMASSLPPAQSGPSESWLLKNLLDFEYLQE